MEINLAKRESIDLCHYRSAEHSENVFFDLACDLAIANSQFLAFSIDFVSAFL